MKVKGLDRFKANLTATSLTVRNGLVKGIEVWARDVRDTSKKSIRSGGRTGIKYPGLPRRSSARGEPPAKQTGNLANSIRSRPLRGGLVRRVGSNLIQAHWELGFGRRIQERPFLKPALRVTTRRGLKRVANEIRRSMR